MDQPTLVEADREIGAMVLDALSRRSMPISLGEWLYIPQLEEWQFVVATAWFDSKGPLATNRAFADALRAAGIYRDVPIRRMLLCSPRNKLVLDLKEKVKARREGFLHLIKHPGNKYSALFSPIAGPGGPVKARHIQDASALQAFLKEDVKIPHASVEKAMDELKHRASTSIFPLALSVQKLRALHLS